MQFPSSGTFLLMRLLTRGGVGVTLHNRIIISKRYCNLNTTYDDSLVEKVGILKNCPAVVMINKIRVGIFILCFCSETKYEL